MTVLTPHPDYSSSAAGVQTWIASACVYETPCDCCHLYSSACTWLKVAVRQAISAAVHCVHCVRLVTVPFAGRWDMYLFSPNVACGVWRVECLMKPTGQHICYLHLPFQNCVLDHPMCWQSLPS